MQGQGNLLPQQAWPSDMSPYAWDAPAGAADASGLFNAVDPLFQTLDSSALLAPPLQSGPSA